MSAERRPARKRRERELEWYARELQDEARSRMRRRGSVERREVRSSVHLTAILVLAAILVGAWTMPLQWLLVLGGALLAGVVWRRWRWQRIARRVVRDPGFLGEAMERAVEANSGGSGENRGSNADATPPPTSGARPGNPDCGQCQAIAAQYTRVHTVICSDCTGGECPLCGELTLRWMGERMLGCPECGVQWPRGVILSNEGFAEANARWGWPDSNRVRRQVRKGVRKHRAAADPHPPWHGSPMAWVGLVGQQLGGRTVAPSAGLVRVGNSGCRDCRTALDRFVARSPEVPDGVPVAITCTKCSEPMACPICGGKVNAPQHVGGGSWINPNCQECGAVALAQDL